MIKLIVSEPGEGKTAAMMKDILRFSEDTCFVNWKTYGLPNCVRLKTDHIFREVEKSDGKMGKAVNWDFWTNAIKKHGGFHIFMDEIQQIVHSRRSSSGFNTLFSQWISQIRKVTGSNENKHFYAVSQRMHNIDPAIRDLATVVIVPSKKQGYSVPTVIRSEGKRYIRDIPRTQIRLTYFTGADCVSKYEHWKMSGLKIYDFRTMFWANGYFKYYDAYEFGDFGNMEYL